MKTIIKYSTILALILFVVSCSKDDETPTKEKEKAGANLESKTFITNNIIDFYEQIDFIDDKTGYALGQTYKNLNINPNYTLLKTIDGEKWTVFNKNIVLTDDIGIISRRKLFFTGEDKAYSLKTTTGEFKRPCRIDLKTGKIELTTYDESIPKTGIPNISAYLFMEPRTKNGNIIAGLCGTIIQDYKGFFVYFINTKTNKIVKMIPVVAPDNYAVLDEKNKPIGIILSEYRSEVHLFSDNSFVVGPIQNPDLTKLDYAFATYDNATGWNNKPTVVKDHGKKVLTAYPFGAQNQKIFGNASGDVLYYIEHDLKNPKSDIGNHILYKITNKGKTITNLPPLLGDVKEKTSHLIMDQKGKGLFYGYPNGLFVATTNDDCQTWKTNKEIKKNLITLQDLAITSNYYYISSNNAKPGKAGIVRIKR